MDPPPSAEGPGEFELIAAIRDRLGAAAQAPDLPLASGDDAAIAMLEGGALAVSVDALVEGVHFRREHASTVSIGRKALAAALSDLAAMGAEARHAYVQLGVPEDAAPELALELADGIAAVAGAHRVAVAGGDLTRSPNLFLAITVLGVAGRAGELVRRSGARPGELVVVTGELGGAAAGLRLLEAPELGARLDPALAADLRRRQLEPEPRLGAGRALAAVGAGAMIDLSDGLHADAGHLAAASAVALRLDLERLPVAAGVRELAALAGEDPLELAATGGEDYELLATVAPELLDPLRDALAGGPALSVIGEVAAGEGVALRPSAAAAGWERAGFDQLRRSPGRDARA